MSETGDETEELGKPACIQLLFVMLDSLEFTILWTTES